MAELGGPNPHEFDDLRPSIYTTHQLNVLRRLASGDTDPQVSRSLRISQNTLKRHKQNIRDRLNDDLCSQDRAIDDLEGSMNMSVSVAIGEGNITWAHTPLPLTTKASERQLEIIAMLQNGKSREEIADDLCISPETVKRHISDIYKVLGAHTTQRVVAISHLYPLQKRPPTLIERARPVFNADAIKEAVESKSVADFVRKIGVSTSMYVGQKLRDVYNRQTVISELADAVRQGKVAVTSVPDEVIQSITPREQEIIEHMVNGKTNKEIIDTLIISPDTLKAHQKHIYKKLGVKSVFGAVAVGVVVLSTIAAVKYKRRQPNVKSEEQ